MPNNFAVAKSPNIQVKHHCPKKTDEGTMNILGMAIHCLSNSFTDYDDGVLYYDVNDILEREVSRS